MTTSFLRPWSYFPLGLRAYRDVFRVTGRARRLEVGEFYIVSMFAVLALRLLGDFAPHIDAGSPAESYLVTWIVSNVLVTLPTLPIIALTARRIQDFDFPGWLSPPLLLYVLAINMWKSLASVTTAYPPSLWKSLAFLAPTEAPSAMLQFLALPIVVAMLISWFVPSTPGPNRYGPAPCRDPQRNLASDPA